VIVQHTTIYLQRVNNTVLIWSPSWLGEQLRNICVTDCHMYLCRCQNHVLASLSWLITCFL